MVWYNTHKIHQLSGHVVDGSNTNVIHKTATMLFVVDQRSLQDLADRNETRTCQGRQIDEKRRGALAMIQLRPQRTTTAAHTVALISQKIRGYHRVSKYGTPPWRKNWTMAVAERAFFAKNRL